MVGYCKDGKRRRVENKNKHVNSIPSDGASIRILVYLFCELSKERKGEWKRVVSCYEL